MKPDPFNFPVTGVVSGSTAEAAGIAAGDIVEAVDSMRIADADALRQIAHDWKPKQSVEIGIRRGDESLQVNVRLMTLQEIVDLQDAEIRSGSRKR